MSMRIEAERGCRTHLVETLADCVLLEPEQLCRPRKEATEFLTLVMHSAAPII